MQHQMEYRTDVLSVLQPVDMNVEEFHTRKKRRFSESESQKHSEMWSLHHSNLILDDLFDNGIKQLDWESDSSPERKQTWSSDSKVEEFRCSGVENYEKPKCDSDDSHLRDSPSCWSNSVKSANCFEWLSDEIVLHIFHWLPKYCLSNVSLVCKRFHLLAQDTSLWERMDVSSRNLSPGVLGEILSRQVMALRMAQAKVLDPPIYGHVKASQPDFRSRLLYLDLSMADISKETLAELFNKCDRIKKLSMELVPVDDNVLLALSRNADIEVINFTMSEGLQLEGLKYLLTNCRKLKELNLAWTGLNASCIKYICSNLPISMDRLNFSGCQKHMTNEHVADLVWTCPSLRELDLSDCTGLSDKSMDYISMLEDLNFLAMSRCYFISYRSFLKLQKLNSLAYLDIHGGFIDTEEIKIIQGALGAKVGINKFKFSSVARPTVGIRRTSIWGLKVRD